MAGGDPFDDELAATLAASLADLRRHLDGACHLVAQGHRDPLAWTGPAHDRWADGLDGCLDDGLDVVDALATAIDDIEDRHARWVFDNRRVWGSGR